MKTLERLKEIEEKCRAMARSIFEDLRQGLIGHHHRPPTAPDYRDLAGLCQNKNVGQFLIRKIAELQAEKTKLEAELKELQGSHEALADALSQAKQVAEEPRAFTLLPIKNERPSGRIEYAYEPEQVDPNKHSEK